MNICYSKIIFIKSNGIRIPIPKSSIDLILLVRVFHEINEKINVLKEFKRILKKDGRVAIIEKIKKSRTFIGPPVIKKFYIIKELKKGGFEPINHIAIGNEILIISKP